MPLPRGGKSEKCSIGGNEMRRKWAAEETARANVSALSLNLGEP
jgi:hypothetical protein